MSRMPISRRTTLAAALAAGTAGFHIGSARADALSKAKSAGKLVVATELHFAPFHFSEGGKAVGLATDIFEQAGKDMGVAIEFLDLPWESVLPGLEAKRYDMVAGPATITKARVARYRFSAPIAEATVALMKKAGDNSIQKPADIAGKQLGGGRATAQLAQFQAYVATLPGTTPPIKEYVSFSEAYADLAAGRIAAVANSFPNLAYTVKQRPNVFALVEPPFGSKSYFGFITRKDDPDTAPLMDALDASIGKMRTSGQLAEMQKKWFGVSFDVPAQAPEPVV
ncbi:transporter substrate-binding domain-containing protein [Acetobacteraceae bacterium H6797]|nr:transporter substrate-binding domain-containing protein [Acetobacteraceae bacterium H6797]